jgi:3-hydroxyisobutyrate dehydrogenase-like beta-hydroxyacid dehydrogenase
VNAPARVPVTVIGLGPMGQAMSRALMAGGHHVTVWNRTPGRAGAVVSAGARLAATPAEAFGAADLIVLSLTEYRAMYEIVGDATAALAGKVLVNLSSDSPDESRRATSWAEEHGAAHLTGGVMVPAPMVGTQDAYVYYSGDRATFDRVERTLRLIGTPRYVGADPGLAQLYYQAQLDVFLTSLASVLHAVALVGSAGVAAVDFVPEALATIRDIPAMLGEGGELARQLDAGEHTGDLSTTTMMGATAHHIVAATEAAGIDPALPLAVRSLYDRAIAAGHGSDNWTSLIEVIRSTPEAVPPEPS